MDKLFKILLNISSTSLLLSIYFIKSQYYILDLTWFYRVISNHWIEPISKSTFLFSNTIYRNRYCLMAKQILGEG